MHNVAGRTDVELGNADVVFISDPQKMVWPAGHPGEAGHRGVVVCHRIDG